DRGASGGVIPIEHQPIPEPPASIVHPWAAGDARGGFKGVTACLDVRCGPEQVCFRLSCRRLVAPWVLAFRWRWGLSGFVPDAFGSEEIYRASGPLFSAAEKPRAFRSDHPGVTRGVESIAGSRHASRHEAANRHALVGVERPDHGVPCSVRLRNHCLVRDINPDGVAGIGAIRYAHAIVALHGLPIR